MELLGFGCILQARNCFALALVLGFFNLAHGFYLPGSYLHAYQQGVELWVKVNSITSVETELPYSYYSLPFCEPLDGVRKSVENLGELLTGDDIENSPYRFHMNVDESNIVLCSRALSERDVAHFKQRIDDLYQVNLMLDNLPVIRYAHAPDSDFTFAVTGYPVGFLVDQAQYLFNHVKFKVLIHENENTGSGSVMASANGLDTIPSGGDQNMPGYTIVGFEVTPCSLKHDPTVSSNLSMYDLLPAFNCEMDGPYQALQVGERVTFSYEVSFQKSSIRWPSRWDAYLRMDGARVHWFSIINSVMVISFLAGIVFVIFLRTVRRDLTRYEDLDKEAQEQLAEELSGWKLIVGDVFRAPRHPKLLCVLVGDGVRLTGMAIVTIFFSALGFMSPASRGMLLTGMVLLFLVLGIAAGYVSCRAWKTLNGGSREDWRSMAWRSASYFPGITFLILTLLNFLLWGSGSTGAIPFSLYLILLAMWFCISVPLTLLGGYLGSKPEHIHFPVRTNQIPREIPPQKYPSWLLILGAGTLPFGTVFIELFFIMSSIWLGRIYYVFGFLFIVLILLIVVCSEVSLILTYMHLCVEDWRWWWKAFFSSGSVAVYFFLYTISYLIFDLHKLSGSISTILYIGYSLLMSLALMIASGTIGLLVSFYFVHYLFSSVKLD
ncbi:hypothetical protein O6H91_17G062400 [Diphasiastrum complanatum]|uniref:Uncharacterized protein n=1 Tax=Diphasiastrum complanatum TaxID=34168 RepID=A0ACC2B8F5_DIPCM|nr:hypothetical protein O6H91_17G062400 [Diphasiastrum complanatum]